MRVQPGGAGRVITNLSLRNHIWFLLNTGLPVLLKTKESSQTGRRQEREIIRRERKAEELIFRGEDVDEGNSISEDKDRLEKEKSLVFRKFLTLLGHF